MAPPRENIDSISLNVFISSPQNQTKPMCAVRIDVLSNDSMKPTKLTIDSESKQKDKKKTFLSKT